MRIWLIFSLLQLCASACALCALYTPTAHVRANLSHMRWDFSPNFSKILKEGYDLNDDGVFDKDELQTISAALIDYLKPRNYLVEFVYYDLPLGASKTLKPKFSEPKVSFYNNLLHMDVDYDLGFKARNNRVLRLSLQDDEGFFNFKIIDDKLKLKNFKVITNINLATAFYEFKSTSAAKPPEASVITNSAPLLSAPQPKALHAVQTAPIAKPPEASVTGQIMRKVSNLLENLLQRLLGAIKHNLAILYPLAFMYGAAHALLPSHGKSFSAAYFVNRRFGAAMFALKVGFVHLLSSYLAVLIFGALAAFRVGFASGYFVFLLAMILIFLKLSKGKFVRLKTFKKVQNLKNFKSANSPSKVANFSRKNSLADWLAVILLGVIPCPGMVLVLGLIAPFGFAAIIAAICMALGMSFSIYFCSFFASRLKISEKTQIILLALAGLLALLMAIYGV